jgi:hypothetical protein
MTDTTDIAPAFNEANIEKALIDAQGDLFVAAQLLGHVTMLKVDRAIRASDRLQAVFLTIKEVKQLPEYDKASQERLEQEIARRMTFYRADGLEALHELATMPVGENSAMAQVKLAAAARLSGTMDRETSSELEDTLRALNDEYHRNAPRIKVTRQTIIEMGPDERVIDSTAQPAD